MVSEDRNMSRHKLGTITHFPNGLHMKSLDLRIFMEARYNLKLTKSIIVLFINTEKSINTEKTDLIIQFFMVQKICNTCLMKTTIELRNAHLNHFQYYSNEIFDHFYF